MFKLEEELPIRSWELKGQVDVLVFIVPIFSGTVASNIYIYIYIYIFIYLYIYIYIYIYHQFDEKFQVRIVPLILVF